MVWATLQLPACNANLEPNQYIPEEEEIEIKKEGIATTGIKSNVEPTVFSLPPISIRDSPMIGSFETPKTAPPPPQDKVPTYVNNPPIAYNFDRGTIPPRLKRPLQPAQQFQFHNYTQVTNTPAPPPPPPQSSHQLPPRQMNYQPPPHITEPNHKSYRGSFDINAQPHVGSQTPQHTAFSEHPNNYTEQNYFRITPDQDPPRVAINNQRNESRELVHERQLPPAPVIDETNPNFHPGNNFGGARQNEDPHYVVSKNLAAPGFFTDRNGFASRNSSGYLSDRLGSRNSSGYLSDRSYESDRELERQSGFFMVMSDDIVSHNPEYMYYYGNGSFSDFSEFPSSFGHSLDLPSIAEPPQKKT